MLINYIKYYATNILQIRKSKIDARKLAASNNCAISQEKNVIEGDIIMNPDNIKINDINEQYYNMKLDTDTFIENLVTLTVYNWQSTDKIDSLVFPTISHI